jgi:4a-hydroxytetrahydrobiopterin dehydratase
MYLQEQKCVPVSKDTPPLNEEQEESYIASVPGWEIQRNGAHSIKKTYSFDHFQEAISFVNNVAWIAEDENHHPDLHIFYNRVDVELSTHAIGGLSENDFIIAAKIDAYVTK